jgi:hypothetical protein
MTKVKAQISNECQMLKNIFSPINSNAAYTGEDAQWEKDK